MIMLILILKLCVNHGLQFFVLKSHVTEMRISWSFLECQNIKTLQLFEFKILNCSVNNEKYFAAFTQVGVLYNHPTFLIDV